MATEREASLVESLVKNHREFLGFLERRVGDRALAEDILQDAFVRSTAKLATLRDDESVTAWFYRILRNAVIDHYRRHTSAAKQLEVFAKELEVSAEAHNETDSAICQCVRSLADTLKPEYATALKRIDVEGQQVKDFAAAEGVSASNAGVRIFRAREALRKQVVKACGSCAEHGCLNCSCQH